MIPFPFNENRFSFSIFIFLFFFFFCCRPSTSWPVGTNPKSDRSLLSCPKVTQCSTSKIGDAPRYNPCSLPIQVMTTIASTLKMQIRTVQRTQGDENKVSGYGYSLWCGFKRGTHHATSRFRSRLESQHPSVPECAEECGDPLVQSGGRWQTLGVAAGLGAGSQVQGDPGLASEGVLRLCTLLSLALLLTRSEPAGLLRLVIRREHHHDLPEHQSQPDRRRLWKRYALRSGSVSRR